MKSYRCFSCLIIFLISLAFNHSVHAISAKMEIHELVDESELVIIGTVAGALSVMVPQTENQDISKMYIGTVYIIRVEKVLYATEKIKQGVFSTSNLNVVNSTLKRDAKRKPLKITAFHQHGLEWGIDMPRYIENQSQLFFFKISQFPANVPDTVVIYDGNRTYESESQISTKASLKEKFYFEATFDDIQSTWSLSWEKLKNMLPTVEAFCEVMSITNPTQREQRLRELLRSNDSLLAQNAEAAIRKIEQTRKEQKPKAKPERTK